MLDMDVEYIFWSPNQLHKKVCTEAVINLTLPQIALVLYVSCILWLLVLFRLHLSWCTASKEKCSFSYWSSWQVLWFVFKLTFSVSSSLLEDYNHKCKIRKMIMTMITNANRSFFVCLFSSVVSERKDCMWMGIFTLSCSYSH